LRGREVPVQALNRTAPILPLRPGLPEKATHDYQRNGTTTSFAALEVGTGKVTDKCYDRHGKAEFLDFLKKVAKAYPRRELHVVLDNYHTHKHDEINAWLAKNPRVTLPLHPRCHGAVKVGLAVIVPVIVDYHLRSLDQVAGWSVGSTAQ
jgi:hypothetical protein